MKKALLLFSLCIGMLYSQEYPPEIQKILDRKELLAGLYDVDTPPLFYKNEKGEWAGSDIEKAKKIANILGVKVRFVPGKTFDDVVTLVSQEKVDLAISNITNTARRSLKVLFTQPYAYGHNYLLISKPFYKKHAFFGNNELSQDEQMKILDDSQYKIGFLKKSAHEDFVHEHFFHAKMVAFDTFNEIYQAVEKNQIDAAIIEEPRNMAALSKNGVLKKTSYKNLICIAVPWKSINFLLWLDNYLFLKERE